MASNTAGRFEEGDETWIPLAPTQDDDGDDLSRVAHFAPATNTPRSAFQEPSSSASSAQTSRGSQPTPPSTRGRSNNHNDNLEAIQLRLQTRVAVQEKLVNHPVDLFWRRFLVNLVREVWALEIRIRLGLIMLIAGFCARIFVYTTWYILYPRVAVLTVMLVGSVLYLDPFDVQRQVKSVANIVVSPDKAFRAMEQLDLSQLRRLSFCLFLIPTMLEIRTLSFLSQIKAEAGWTWYNLGVSGLLLVVMLLLHDRRGMNPRECSYQGMLILYGSALLITVVSLDVRRIPFLAAPFLTATGTLLLTYQDDDMEWLSRIVRHTLRLTLRDVLSSVGERVAEDELLQLAILRWICDFWANDQQNPGPSSTSAAQETSSGSTTRPEAAAAGSQSTRRPSRTSDEVPPVPSSERPSGGWTANEFAPAAHPPQEEYQRHDVQWDELLPMLNIEIAHMEAEVEALQSENRADLGAGGTNEGGTSRTQSSHRAGTGRSGRTNGEASSEEPEMQSFEALKSMLLSLNVDERGKPAVLAYRRAVESFPPEKRSAVAVSVLRRCPALLTLMFHVLFGGYQTLFTSFVILVPFIIMEYLRITSWIESCRRVASVSDGVRTASNDGEGSNPVDWGIPHGLNHVDSMVILLCGDAHSTLRPPTLLLVWHNIASSVNALEVGLTAARCAETTVVAVDFAGNVMDLVQFGFEVSQQGLLHGLLVMAKEALSIHAMGADMNNLGNVDGESARFTRAAVRAVQSGQRVARNLHLLSEDEHIGTIVHPLLITIGFLTGRGWLWGHDNGQQDTATSSTDNASLDEMDAENKEFNRTSPTESELPTKEVAEASVAIQESKRLSVLRISPSEATQKERRHDDLTGPSPSPQDDLSEVMEMVSKAYEQGLIETEEKNDFYEKLSSLNASELYDVSVVSGMKRTLSIILENGCTISVDDDTLASRPVGDSFAVICPESERSVHVVDDVASPSRSGNELTHESDSTREPSLGQDQSSIPLHAPTGTSNTSEGINSRSQETTSDDRSGAFVTLGVAALGVVAGGLFLSMRGGNGDDDNGDNGNRTSTEEGHERNESSTVQIEELPDDRDEDWVSVSQ